MSWKVGFAAPIRSSSINASCDTHTHTPRVKHNIPVSAMEKLLFYYWLTDYNCPISAQYAYTYIYMYMYM